MRRGGEKRQSFLYELLNCYMDTFSLPTNFISIIHSATIKCTRIEKVVCLYRKMVSLLQTTRELLTLTTAACSGSVSKLL